MSNIINVGVTKEILPTLNNPATESDIILNKQAIGQNKEIITGNVLLAGAPFSKEIQFPNGRYILGVFSPKYDANGITIEITATASRAEQSNPNISIGANRYAVNSYDYLALESNITFNSIPTTHTINVSAWSLGLTSGYNCYMLMLSSSVSGGDSADYLKDLSYKISYY